MRLYSGCLAIMLLAFSSASAQGKYNKVLKVGQAAPAWSDLPGVDGKKTSLADLKDKAVVLLVVTCNHCPIAVRYEDRIIAFVKKHANAPVALVAVNVNHREADRLPKMQERAKSKGFNFAYLFDESQKIGKLYGAKFTPEFFVLDKERKIAYLGAMDDNNDPQAVKANYLENAVAALLEGKTPAITETKGRGCAVEYE